MWLCRCDCGGDVAVTAGNLASGHTTRCGRSCGMSLKTGARYGALTVVRDTGRRDANASELWECRCDCGAVAEVAAYDLLRGNITSCGCHSERDRRADDSVGRIGGTKLSMLGSAPPSNNTSGVRGVVRDRRRGKWIAQIKFRGRNYRLGEYRELADAASARREAEELLWGPLLEEHGRALMGEDEWQGRVAEAIEKIRDGQR